MVQQSFERRPRTPSMSIVSRKVGAVGLMAALWAVAWSIAGAAFGAWVTRDWDVKGLPTFARWRVAANGAQDFMVWGVVAGLIFALSLVVMGRYRVLVADRASARKAGLAGGAVGAVLPLFYWLAVATGLLHPRVGGIAYAFATLPTFAVGVVAGFSAIGGVLAAGLIAIGRHDVRRSIAKGPEPMLPSTT